MKLYPDCGCPATEMSASGGFVLTNGVCRNADCIDYGHHRRMVLGDRCFNCGQPFTPLASDPFKGAR